MDDESPRQRYLARSLGAAPYSRQTFLAHTFGAARYRRIKNPFWRGFWRGFGALGDVGPTGFNPPRYPQDTRFWDQACIGSDMYKALEVVNEEAKTIKPHAS